MSWLSRCLWTHALAPRTLVWAGLLCVLAAVCWFVPLVDALGFEFAFVMALVGSFAAADLGGAAVRRARGAERRGLERAGSPGVVVAELAAGAVVVNLLLLVLPMAIIALNAVRVRVCDWGFGVQAYLLLPVGSVVGATALGVVCGLAVPARRRVLANALPHALVLAWLLTSVWRFYTEPPVFAYNAFGGYFPGNLYDENISLGAPLYWSRALQVCCAVAALALAAVLVDAPTLRLAPLSNRRPIGARPRATAVAAAAGAIAALLWMRGDTLGFAVDGDAVRAELSGRYQTEHFVIHYEPSDAMERRIALIAEDHEFRYAQAVAAFGGVEPDGVIHSYYFSSADQKRRLFGAERVHMAKPWRREIFLNDYPFPHPILRHEIAHVIAGAFGDPLFGVSARRVAGVPALVNVGLVEGAAVAADWPGRYEATLTPHESVKAMADLGYMPPLHQLMSPGFFQFSAGRSYTTAGSFARFLLDRYGAERFRALYRSGGDFTAAYGRGLGELTAEWRAMIDAIELHPGAAEQVRERFRRGSILERPCPHAIARRRERAARLQARGDRGGAIAAMRSVCRDDPAEPRWRLDLASLLLADERVDDAAALLLALADDEALSSTVRATAMLELVDIAARAGELADAGALLDRAAALPIEDDDRRIVVAKRFALDHGGPAGAHLRAYFWGAAPGEPHNAMALAGRAAAVTFAEPELAFGWYLLGRMMFLHDAFADALPYIERAHTLGLSHPLLARENARVGAIAAFHAGRMADVERFARVLDAPDQPAIVRLLGRDWLERVQWRRSYGTVLH